MSRWTADEIATASRLWREGFSQAEVAAAVGRSLSAVAGKIHGTRGRKPIGAKRNCNQRAPSPRAIRERRASVRKEKIVRQPEPITPLNIPFLDIEFGQCRAITDATRNEQKCCGHPVDERGTYCAAHRALFYTQSKGKSA